MDGRTTLTHWREHSTFPGSMERIACVSCYRSLSLRVLLVGTPVSNERRIATYTRPGRLARSDGFCPGLFRSFLFVYALVALHHGANASKHRRNGEVLEQSLH